MTDNICNDGSSDPDDNRNVKQHSDPEDPASNKNIFRCHPSPEDM